MKIFSPEVSSTHPQDLWNVVGLGERGGVALIDKINQGLEGTVAKRISEWAQITRMELQKMSGIPGATFNRGIKTRFSAGQSERLVRMIGVIELTVRLFEGDKAAAQKWLHEANRALNWKTPASVLSSETGALEVMRLITRIEQGVVS
ncbi:type II RES/Xre toxin-antitoxin system antitoxin [Citrobacter werkmanii]|uniref:type II RES/Xre toxin-antitoxin system antitoxin n=1 Tax=Citrobacter werkmanii TaxID=67827 RepID=UPI00264B4815|nr:antitoxin Xre/MbcA/ParS toxin-binding domain-containing protein [Citrobacter werkmanii]MDN8558368.1 DUF2384 domain-containing protein [Citrobacter werkmanii]